MLVIRLVFTGLVAGALQFTKRKEDVPRQGRTEAALERGAARTQPRSGIAPWRPEALAETGVRTGAVTGRRHVD